MERPSFRAVVGGAFRRVLAQESKHQPPTTADPLEVPYEVGISRRRFFFLGAAAGITLAAAPLVDLLPAVDPFPEFWYRRALYGRVQFTSVEICAGRRAGKSAFVAAWRAETDALIRDIAHRENAALVDGRRLQLFPLTTQLAQPYPQQSMGLNDEEVSIDAADWGEKPSYSNVDEKLWRAQTMGSFETPQQPPVPRERRRPGDWTGPGRRKSDVGDLA